MNKSQFMLSLDLWDRQGRRVFTMPDLRKIFSSDSEKALKAQLSRFCSETEPVVSRAIRGVYVNLRSRQPATHLLEEIARTIRRGSHNYISLESALSEHGRISQIPVSRLTVMTTGRSAEYQTPWGTIEFTHTDRDPGEFLADLVDVGRPLRLAGPDRALRDLRRVGRNLHLVQDEPEEADHARFF